VAPFAISILVLVVVLAGAWLGNLLRSQLPTHHLSAESVDVVKVGTGLMATLAALVIAFLVGTANTSLHTKSDEVQRLAANAIMLDRTLRQYGPEAGPARTLLRELLGAAVERVWGKGSPNAVLINPAVVGPTTSHIEKIQDLLMALAPANDTQRLLRERALQLGDQIMQIRWLLLEQTEGSIPVPFLVVLLFWLTGISCGLSLFAPRNGTVRTVIVIYAISVASAILLILEMDRPFGGLLKMSDVPMRTALQYLDAP